MSTTLKLPEELKRRIAEAARERQKTAHAFMVDAIREETDRAERQRSFLDAAKTAQAEFEKTGLGYAMDDVHRYVLGVADGQTARKPRKKRWPR